MFTEDPTLSFAELCQRTGESERTLRYYVQLGLLAGPSEKGPAARYPVEHVARVAEIRALQAEGEPLRNILRELQARELQARELRSRDKAEKSSPRLSHSGSLRRNSDEASWTAPGDWAPTNAIAHYLAQASLLSASGQTRSAPRAPQPEWAPERSRWERVVLDEGVELMVRRPLDTWRQRKVEKLLRAAAQVFGSGTSDSEP